MSVARWVRASPERLPQALRATFEAAQAPRSRRALFSGCKAEAKHPAGDLERLLRQNGGAQPQDLPSVPRRCPGEGLLRLRVERLLRPLGPPGEGGEALRRQAFLRENRHDFAPPHPREAVVVVRGILDECPVLRHAERGQRGLRHPEKRADMEETGTPDDGTHAGKPRKARPAGQPHQNRLGLVVAGVGGHEMRCAKLAGVRAQERVAGAARCLLQARLRLSACPREDFVRKIQAHRPPRRRKRPLAPILAAIRDRRSRPRRAGPAFRRASAPEGASGKSNRDRPKPRRGCPQPRGARRTGAEVTRPKGRSRASAAPTTPQVHFARFCSRSAPCRTFGDACGYFRSSSAKTAQARSRAPRALSDIPSLRSASGALIDFG